MNRKTRPDIKLGIQWRMMAAIPTASVLSSYWLLSYELLAFCAPRARLAAAQAALEEGKKKKCSAGRHQVASPAQFAWAGAFFGAGLPGLRAASDYWR